MTFWSLLSWALTNSRISQFDKAEMKVKVQVNGFLRELTLVMSKGLHQLVVKVKAICQAPASRNIESYLGLLTYYGKFLPTHLASLYKLLRMKGMWKGHPHYSANQRSYVAVHFNSNLLQWCFCLWHWCNVQRSRSVRYPEFQQVKLFWAQGAEPFINLSNQAVLLTLVWSFVFSSRSLIGGSPLHLKQLQESDFSHCSDPCSSTALKYYHSCKCWHINLSSLTSWSEIVCLWMNLIFLLSLLTKFKSALIKSTASFKFLVCAVGIS